MELHDHLKVARIDGGYVVMSHRLAIQRGGLETVIAQRIFTDEDVSKMLEFISSELINCGAPYEDGEDLEDSVSDSVNDALRNNMRPKD